MKKTIAVLISCGILSVWQIGLVASNANNSNNVQAAVNREVTQSSSKSRSALANMTGTYDNARPGRMYGKALPKSDLTVVGVTLGANFSDIQQSLGTPTSVQWRGSQSV